jgi:hypothetical protein
MLKSPWTNDVLADLHAVDKCPRRPVATSFFLALTLWRCAQATVMDVVEVIPSDERELGQPRRKVSSEMRVTAPQPLPCTGECWKLRVAFEKVLFLARIVGPALTSSMTWKMSRCSFSMRS